MYGALEIVSTLTLTSTTDCENCCRWCRHYRQQRFQFAFLFIRMQNVTYSTQKKQISAQINEHNHVQLTKQETNN